MRSVDLLVGDPTVCQLCRLLLLFVLLLNSSFAFKKRQKGGTGFFILFLTMFIYCVFYSPDNGDNYTSMFNYYAYLDGADKETLHFENVYFYIMDLVPFGYVYYRMVIWGGACLLFIWLTKRLQVKSQYATLSALTFAVPVLMYYQRAAFAHVLLYTAVQCYLSRGRILGNSQFFLNHFKLLSLGILLSALPFHTSMPVYVVIVLVALFIPKNKVGLLSLFVVLLLFSLSLLSNSIFVLQYLGADTLETGMRSLDGDTGIVGRNLNGDIADFIHWLPVYVLLLYELFKMVKIPDQLSDFEKTCVISAFMLIAIATMFTNTSHTILGKFRVASMMPLTLFLASYFNKYAGNKECTYFALATIATSFI